MPGRRRAIKGRCAGAKRRCGGPGMGPLLDDHAAVDHEQLPGHVVGFRTRKKRSRSDDVLGIRVALHQDHVLGEAVHGLTFPLELANCHEILVELLPELGAHR